MGERPQRLECPSHIPPSIKFYNYFQHAHELNTAGHNPGVNSFILFVFTIYSEQGMFLFQQNMLNRQGG